MMHQTQVLLVKEDEVEISTSLRQLRPSIKYVDDTRWKSRVPPLKDSIALCTSPYVLLWDTAVVEILPTLALEDGEFEGPQTAYVATYWRPLFRGDALLAGRIAASSGGNPRLVELMNQFFKDIWRIVELHTTEVVPTSTRKEALRGKVEFRAGHGAIAWVSEDANRRLCDRNEKVTFRPR